MDSETIQSVGERYGFDEWRGTNRLDRNVVLENLVVPNDLLDGLRSDRIRSIDMEDGTRLIRATWEADGKGVNKLDIRECPTRDDAHRVLLELLANMQSPSVARMETDGAPGDIAFADKPSAALVFARANIAVRIDSGSPDSRPATGIAEAVDVWIVDSARSTDSPAKGA